MTEKGIFIICLQTKVIKTPVENLFKKTFSFVNFYILLKSLSRSKQCRGQRQNLIEIIERATREPTFVVSCPIF